MVQRQDVHQASKNLISAVAIGSLLEDLQRNECNPTALNKREINKGHNEPRLQCHDASCVGDRYIWFENMISQDV